MGILEKLRYERVKSGFGLWYRSHVTTSVEHNGSWTHYNWRVIAMDLFKKLIIASVIGSYPLIFFAGRWVEFTQFRLFCFG